jgi:threonine dehydrogenase-like Zn-dependent dehydrogenase
MCGAVMYGPDDVRVEERRFLPDLIQLIWDCKIDPGKVFDLTLPLDQAAKGYKAMDERRRHEGAADSVSREG